MPISIALSRFLFSYRNTPQTSTNKSPSELMFNRTIRTRLSNLKMNGYKQDIDTEEEFSTCASSKILRNFYVEDRVWI